MFGKSPIKWRQCPDMTIVVDWDVKHQFKQKQKIYLIFSLLRYFYCLYEKVDYSDLKQHDLKLIYSPLNAKLLY